MVFFKTRKKYVTALGVIRPERLEALASFGLDHATRWDQKALLGLVVSLTKVVVVEALMLRDKKQGMWLGWFLSPKGPLLPYLDLNYLNWFHWKTGKQTLTGCLQTPVSSRSFSPPFFKTCGWWEPVSRSSLITSELNPRRPRERKCWSIKINLVLQRHCLFAVDSASNRERRR